MRALEIFRKDPESLDYGAKDLLQTLRGFEGSLGIRGRPVGLADTIRRIYKMAYVDMVIMAPKTKRGTHSDAYNSDESDNDDNDPDEGMDDEDTPQGRTIDSRNPTGSPAVPTSANANERRRKSLMRKNLAPTQVSDTADSAGPSNARSVKPEREKAIKAVTFKRHQDESHDFAFDWKVASPHAPPLLACSREWHEAHGTQTILVPQDLRQALEEDLGIHEEALPPPGQGAYEDRPAGNARESGTLRNAASAEAVFVPPTKPRSTKEGYLELPEMLPWEPLRELIDEVNALLGGILQHDVRSKLERGKKALKRMQTNAEPLEEEQGIKSKPTFYGRRMPIGRLTGGGSSMPPVPNVLRQKLYRGLLHDLDFVNCHPTIMLGLVRKHRAQTWERDAPTLLRYVEHRHDFLDEIARYYGLPGAGSKVGRDLAKTAILVVINGGVLTYWRTKVKSPVSPLKPDLPALLQLQREALWVRETIVFKESAFAHPIAHRPHPQAEAQRGPHRGRFEEERLLVRPRPPRVDGSRGGTRRARAPRTRHSFCSQTD